jgi:hypothetical protein
MSLAREDDYLHMSPGMIKAVKDFYDTYFSEVKKHETTDGASIKEWGKGREYYGYKEDSDHEHKKTYYDYVTRLFGDKIVATAEFLSQCGDVLRGVTPYDDDDYYIYSERYWSMEKLRVFLNTIKKLPNNFPIYRCIMPRKDLACDNLDELITLLDYPNDWTPKELNSMYNRLKRAPLIDMNRLGVFWTYDKSSIECYDAKNTCHTNIIVKATVSETQVDWLSTLMINVANSDEHEIRVKKNQRLQIEALYYPYPGYSMKNLVPLISCKKKTSIPILDKISSDYCKGIT